MDTIYAIGRGVSDTVASFGKSVSSVVNNVVDKGASVVNGVVSAGSGIVNKTIDIGGGVLNKGADIVGGAASTLSFLPLALLVGGVFIAYKLINNAEPVGRAISNTATSIAPMVASTAI